MNKGFRFNGEWWLPDNPDLKFQGLITYIPGNDIIFELIDRRTFNLAQNHESDIILGKLLDGRLITLIDSVFVNSGPASEGGGHAYRFDVKYVIINEHFSKIEDIKLHSIWANYTYLDEWVGISGLTVQHYHKGEDIIKYKRPDNIEVQLDDIYKLIIWFGGSGPAQKYQFQKEASIKQMTFVQIEVNDVTQYNELFDRMHHFHDFLSLAVLESVGPTHWKALVDEDDHNILEIFYKQSEISEFLVNLPSFHMVFTYDDIKNNFDTILINWFSSYQKLSHVYGLYFGTIYNSHLYQEQRFINVVQAIEVFHRRIFEGKYLKDDDYEKIYEDLIQHLPPENPAPGFNESLKGKLEYGNEYSLQKRLKEIFEKYVSVDGRLYKQRGTLITKAVKNRNYLTHFSEELEEERATGKDLYFLTQEMRLVLIICILKEIGFTPVQISDLRYSFPVPIRDE